MKDGATVVRRGEKVYLWGEVDAATGTTTISAQPTFTLYDTLGVAVTGFNGINVTDYDHAAGASPRAWTQFDPLASSLAAGLYVGVTKIPHTGSDGLARTALPSVVVLVTEAYR